jgi:hypothetical protein
MTAWKDQPPEYRKALAWFVVPPVARALLGLLPNSPWLSHLGASSQDAYALVVITTAVVALGWALAGFVYVGRVAWSITMATQIKLVVWCVVALLASVLGLALSLLGLG